MKELNKQYRGLDKTTDVLSFPIMDVHSGEILSEAGDMIYFDDSQYFILGDIVISMDAVKKQAEEYGHSVEREFAFLSVHSFLHLIGFDHEPSGKASDRGSSAGGNSNGNASGEEMFALQEQILTKCGIER